MGAVGAPGAPVAPVSSGPSGRVFFFNFVLYKLQSEVSEVYLRKTKTRKTLTIFDTSPIAGWWTLGAWEPLEWPADSAAPLHINQSSVVK